MAFWSGAKLRTEVANQQIVKPFSKTKIDCSAYTLTLGAEAFVSPSFGDNLRENLKLALDEPAIELVGGREITKGGGEVVIPPGQFAFLLTEEIIQMPKDVMGFISLKSSAKFQGLINVSGFHVDPGFAGRLIYSVFNAGPSALHFNRGDDLFLLWLTDLDGRATKPFYKDKPGYVDIPSSLVSQVSRETYSLQSLSDQVDQLADQVKLFKAVASGAAAGLALMIAVLTYIGLQPASPSNVETATPEAALPSPNVTPRVPQLPRPAETQLPEAPVNQSEGNGQAARDVE
ncbi:MAG: hypothetical protein H6920_00420 [Sphingomonadaceae bacterium]|nr:hypothetical protein [Sphingomonadaceae bacterium]MCP5384762.1 hypothetical protein [Altererythrobacter sp.]MCP5390078.1 hypothetical protein [Sphingomonadaceae bacterium]MCP5392588.1 hypothetical protein [Sphingomonadaceae bacterium]